MPLTPDHRHLRPVGEPNIEPLSDQEAIDVASTSWRAARAAQLDLAGGQLLAWLFSPAQVTSARLLIARTKAREQLDKARTVEAALDDAVSAFEATRPRGES